MRDASLKLLGLIVIGSVLLLGCDGESGDVRSFDAPTAADDSSLSMTEELQAARDIAACRAVVRRAATLQATLPAAQQRRLLSSWYRRHRQKGRDQRLPGLTVQQARALRKAKKRKWLDSGTRMSS